MAMTWNQSDPIVLITRRVAKQGGMHVALASSICLATHFVARVVAQPVSSSSFRELLRVQPLIS